MSKDDAAKYLVENGFDAEVVDGVVRVYHKPGEGDGLFEKIGKILKEKGYLASYGTRAKV